MSFTFNVLAPLHVAAYSPGNLEIAGRKPLIYDPQGDFEAFRDELVAARKLGVNAISMDVWWGLVQPHRPGDFHWGYYERFIKTVSEANAADANGAAQLQIAPILSFHQCGGNVGDNFYIPLPQWVVPEVLSIVRAELGDANVDAVDILYLSETGSPSSEYIAHWADSWALPLYAEFMQRFKSFCERVKVGDRPASELIQEVNVSVGPSGEIRYPSYNLHDWGEFPLWGPLQCNGNLAERAWANSANNLPSLKSILGEPGDGQIRSLLAFANRLHRSDSTWSALFGWYSRSLYEHAARVLNKANDIFWDWQVPLGFKIPGVHWRANVLDPNQKLNKEAYLNPEEMHPRLPEMSAGLISSDGYPSTPQEGQYVDRLCDLVKNLSSRKAGYNLHFTCLEKSNDFDNPAEGYSIAGTLIDQIASAVTEVNKQGSTKGWPQLGLKGENALPTESDTLLQNLKKHQEYSGITILRISNLFKDGKPTQFAKDLAQYEKQRR